MEQQKVWLIWIADDIKVACFASFSKSPPHLSGYNWVARLIEQTALQSSDSFQNWFEKNVGFHSCRYDILLLNCKNNLYILHNWDVQDICAFNFLLPNLTPDNFTLFLLIITENTLYCHPQAQVFSIIFAFNSTPVIEPYVDCSAGPCLL